MTQPFLEEQRRGGVLLITLNRPEERNALSTPEQCDEIVAATRRINADTTLKAVVQTGARTSFCAGGNVKHMRSRVWRSATASALLRMSASTDLRSSLEATAALQSLAHQSPEHAGRRSLPGTMAGALRQLKATSRDGSG